LTLSEGVTPQEVLKALVAQDVVVEHFELALPRWKRSLCV
jgi:hypothetical protein